MTTQEYVKKEADARYGLAGYSAKLHFENGLFAGIELAKEFHKWSDYNKWERYEVNGDTWYKFSNTPRVITTSELFEIFLTKRNENRNKD